MSVRWYGDRVNKQLEAAAREALWKLGQLAITEATDNVPIESGTLRRSATVTVGDLPDPDAVYAGAQGGDMRNAYPDTSGGDGEPRAFVSYNTPYAAWLHETYEWEPKRAGGPKWLERAFPVVAKRFGELVRRAMRKKGA